MQVKEAFASMGWQSTLFPKPRTPVCLFEVNATVYDSSLARTDVQCWPGRRPGTEDVCTHSHRLGSQSWGCTNVHVEGALEML